MTGLTTRTVTRREVPPQSPRAPVTPREQVVSGRNRHVATPPVAASSPERSVRFADPESSQCRDLSELCQEAAAVEVANLLLGSEEPTFQHAHAVANLLLSTASPRQASASRVTPPYLKRLWMLRRARRRVRAIRQVKQILGLRDELLLRSLVSAWQQRAQLRRLVLCGKAISEASAAKREASRCCNDRSSSCLLTSQVLLHWSVATARAIRGRPLRRQAVSCQRRQRHSDGVAAVLRRAEAACRLVLLYASLHAWSECLNQPAQRKAGGVWTSRREMRLLLLAWAHLTRQRAQQGGRLAQESAELLRLHLRYLQLRQREAETFHSHRLVEGSFNSWLHVLEVNRERKLRVKRPSLARAPQRLRARFAAWRWLWQLSRRQWHMACVWNARGEKGRQKDLMQKVLLSWHSAMQDAWCFRAFEEACAEKYARSALTLEATACFGRCANMTDEESLSPSDTIFNSEDCHEPQVGRTLSLSSSSPAA